MGRPIVDAIVPVITMLLLVPSTSFGEGDRLDTLRSNLKPGDKLSMRVDSGPVVPGEYERLLVPDYAVRLRVWDTEHDRFRSEDMPLDRVDRCVRLRTGGMAAFPAGGALLLGAVGARFGVAMDDGLGDDSPGTLAVVAPFALAGALGGVVIGAVVMPTRTKATVLWDR